jgi:hypothetical protein
MQAAVVSDHAAALPKPSFVPHGAKDGSQFMLQRNRIRQKASGSGRAQQQTFNQTTDTAGGDTQTERATQERPTARPAMKAIFYLPILLHRFDLAYLCDKFAIS